jgi:hypothetical protein
MAEHLLVPDTELRPYKLYFMKSSTCEVEKDKENKTWVIC